MEVIQVPHFVKRLYRNSSGTNTINVGHVADIDAEEQASALLLAATLALPFCEVCENTETDEDQAEAV